MQRVVKEPELFATTGHSGCNMDSRLGGRHEKVYEYSRQELDDVVFPREMEAIAAQRELELHERWVAELCSLAAQADEMIGARPEREQSAALYLQQALIDLIGDDCSDDGSEPDSDATYAVSGTGVEDSLQRRRARAGSG